ncbi:hypothetical protein [Corynebacterium halotolerans]|uniref:hypothetical protein n=1 Tax=Corynebacterium halotolerans TaxID=225326 RepID=UPI0011EA65A0|nr:hypothetical protein [Corynebacterium halotolerans]
MSHPGEQPNQYPAFNPIPQPIEKKPGWSTKKKVGVTLGSLAALGVTFFAGFGTGYEEARSDIIAAYEDAFSDAFSKDLVEPATDASDDYTATQEPESLYPVTLNVGDSVDVPCSMYSPEDGTCMTLTLTEVNSQAVCPESNHVGRFVSLAFEATMPADADSDFTSPFRSFPWSATTTDGRMTGVMPESYCNGAGTHSDLRAEFPGYSAIGTSFLPVPDNVAEVHFESDHENLFIVPIE